MFSLSFLFFLLFFSFEWCFLISSNVEEDFSTITTSFPTPSWVSNNYIQFWLYPELAQPPKLQAQDYTTSNPSPNSQGPPVIGISWLWTLKFLQTPSQVLHFTRMMHRQGMSGWEGVELPCLLWALSLDVFTSPEALWILLFGVFRTLSSPWRSVVGLQFPPL